MKVMVTGGTGYLGSHSVAALVRAGHEVRMLVRDPAGIAPAVKPLGIDEPDHVVGDITDRASVERALDGCDAVVHAAAVVALDRKGGELAAATNAVGAKHVIGAAHERGLDPIVHVSSLTVLWRPGLDIMTPDTPVTPGKGGYEQSKADAELFARKLQDDGVPVVITYPAMVLGPQDPKAGITVQMVASWVKQGVLVTTGGSPISDVRDIGAGHAAVIEAGRGPRRYTFGGHFVPGAEVLAILRELTGRKVRRLPAPAPVLRVMAGVFERLGGVISAFDTPFTSEAVEQMTQWMPCDDSRTIDELGITFRPVEDTLRDTIRWLVEKGMLDPKLAGAALDA